MTGKNSSQTDSFLEYLNQQGYAEGTAEQYRKAIDRFLQWCTDTPLGVDRPLDDSLRDYLNRERTRYGHPRAYTMLRAAVRRYFLFVTGQKLQIDPKPSLDQWVKDELAGFHTFLVAVAALAEATIESRLGYVGRFLSYASSQGATGPADITANHIRDFLTTDLAHYRPVSRKSTISRIRSYFRYLVFRGEHVDEGVLSLPFSAPVWSLSSLPRALTSSEMKSLLDSFDQSTAEGVRDYAITLCLSEMGLRCSEVATLTLGDFDWYRATVLIRETKTHSARCLPISSVVGEAIVKYLMHTRQFSSEQALFLSISRRNGRPVTPEQVRNVIRRAYIRAGITWVTGTHALRHTRACTLYESGVSLKVIADILGHKSIDTSRIYTKTNTTQLRSVACPWPEVSRS